MDFNVFLKDYSAIYCLYFITEMIKINSYHQKGPLSNHAIKLKKPQLQQIKLDEDFHHLHLNQILISKKIEL